MKLSRESQVSLKNLGSQGITSARLSIGCEESRSSCDIPTWDPWAFQSLVTDREMLSRRIRWLSSAPVPETGGALCGQCACHMKGAQIAPFVVFSRNKGSCLAHPSDIKMFQKRHFYLYPVLLISGVCTHLRFLSSSSTPASEMHTSLSIAVSLTVFRPLLTGGTVCGHQHSISPTLLPPCRRERTPLCFIFFMEQPVVSWSSGFFSGFKIPAGLPLAHPDLYCLCCDSVQKLPLPPWPHGNCILWQAVEMEDHHSRNIFLR